MPQGLRREEIKKINLKLPGAGIATAKTSEADIKADRRPSERTKPSADDTDDFVESGSSSKKRKLEQKTLAGLPARATPPAAPAAKPAKPSAKKAASTKTQATAAPSRKETKAKAAGSSQSAPPEAAPLSPNGKRIRQATLDASGGLKPAPAKAPTAPAAQPESDPIVDATPSVPTESDLFMDRCRTLFKSVWTACIRPAGLGPY